jgi:hypothetical protein
MKCFMPALLANRTAMMISVTLFAVIKNLAGPPIPKEENGASITSLRSLPLRASFKLS